jgi:hypothetical protein
MLPRELEFDVRTSASGAASAESITTSPVRALDRPASAWHVNTVLGGTTRRHTRAVVDSELMRGADFMALLEAELQGIAKIARSLPLSDDDLAEMGRRLDNVRAQTASLIAQGLSDQAKRDGLAEVSRMRASVAALQSRRS